MRWVWALAVALALCVPARAAAEGIDCPGRPWPKAGAIEVTKTTAGGMPVVNKIGHFATEGGLTPAERFRVTQSVVGQPGQRATASNYSYVGRLSCLYDYSYEFIMRSVEPFRVTGQFFHSARALPDGARFTWPVNCVAAERRCQLQPHHAHINDASAFLIIALSDKYPAGEVCVEAAPPTPGQGDPTVNLLADGARVVSVGVAAKADDRYVCLGEESPPLLARLKSARRITYERVRAASDTARTPFDHGEIEAQGLGEAVDFARSLRERVALAPGRQEAEARARTAAEERMRTAE